MKVLSSKRKKFETELNSLLELSDKIIKIPMFGKVSSLNVATSSAVILFESVRQRN